MKWQPLTSPHPLVSIPTQLQQNSCNMFCFLKALGLNDFDGANPSKPMLLGPLEGVGPENLDFFGPNSYKQQVHQYLIDFFVDFPFIFTPSPCPILLFPRSPFPLLHPPPLPLFRLRHLHAGPSPQERVLSILHRVSF